MELAIQGGAGRGCVDSLNVSVAAGILCNAFLRNNNESSSREQEVVVNKVDGKRSVTNMF